jgi:ribosome biogenesis GTPase
MNPRVLTGVVVSSLESLGFDPFFSEQHVRLDRADLVPARVGAEGRGRYGLLGCTASTGELKGRLRHELDPVDWPVVGDWLAVADNEHHAVIHHIFDRRTAMVRRAAGTASGIQVVAANVDLFFIVTAANRDFNVRRLERYLAAVWDSGAEPVVVLNKIDIGGVIEDMAEAIEAVGSGVPVVRSSAITGDGLNDLRRHLGYGKTVGLVGSSGVGKSSLVNRLLDREAQFVRTVRKDDKGRHATTRRELIELPDGGMLIDTPGMRELGLIDDAGGVDHAFADIATLAEECHFRDCQHEGEPGCAVAAAVDAGTLDRSRLESYHKLQREIAAAERRRDPRLASHSKRRWKWISKAMRARSKDDPKHRR